jgi:hypothetical protein
VGTKSSLGHANAFVDLRWHVILVWLVEDVYNVFLSREQWTYVHAPNADWHCAPLSLRYYNKTRDLHPSPAVGQ